MNGKCSKYCSWIQLLTQNAAYKSFQEQHGCSHKIHTPGNVLLYNNRNRAVQALQDTQPETLVIKPNDSLYFIKKESGNLLNTKYIKFTKYSRPR